MRSKTVIATFEIDTSMSLKRLKECLRVVLEGTVLPEERIEQRQAHLQVAQPAKPKTTAKAKKKVKRRTR